MTHDANRCLCEECLDYRAAQVRRNRRRGLRDLSTFTPVVVTRDTATGATSSEPVYDGLGHTSSTVGEGAPTPREARATVLDALPRPTCAEVSGPAGPESTLLVHQRAGGLRLGEAS